MRYFKCILFVFLTGCLFQDGTVDIDLRWEDLFTGRYTTCRQAEVDKITWRVVDDYGDTVKDSIDLVSCRDNITRDLRAGDYALEVEGYQYDWWDDVYYLEWRTLCTGVKAYGNKLKQYRCEVNAIDRERYDDRVQEVADMH